jgi:D-serine deaminase-like pyridoxal phosphate-dependent protein
MHIFDLETPSVLLDLDRVERNISRMQVRCDELGINFRPHIKTHKIPDLAQMQLDAGAVGIACQKVSEAQIFAEAGFDNIQIPYNIVGTPKTSKLADLALYNTITVSVDHEDVVAGLAEAAHEKAVSLRVLIELATDLERTGASVDDVVPLATRIEREENLQFAGLMLYPSKVLMRPLLQEALHQLDRAGIGVQTVSGGGTGAALEAHAFPELTELRVGTYIFNDWMQVCAKVAALEDCAMHIAATVVSRPTAERALLDCGSKTLASDRYDGSFGYIEEYPQARIYNLNEEHAYVDVSACEKRPQIGERVHVIPVHTCVVMNLANRVFGVRGEQVEREWTVTARGCVW